MRIFLTAAMVCVLALPISIKAQNIYPASGNVSIFDYSPLLILQRNTPDGGFIQGIQTRLYDGTNSWFYGAVQKDQWVVSKGDYSNPKLVIEANGNLGIGTTIADSKVSIQNSGDGSILSSKTSYSTHKNIFEVTQEASDAFLYLRSANGDVFTKLSGYSTTPSYFMTNVGIGTTEPGHFKLAVEGTIGAREVVVTATSPWPDYVFNHDYKLRSLEEIERYVSTEKHLPDVPSAEAVAKDGVNLGEMNAILLRKVEELTLLLIEQNKRIQLLEAKVIR